MNDQTQYCPWCSDGATAPPDAVSRICERHWNELRQQFETRRRRSAGRAYHPTYELPFGGLDWARG
ncbi:MAG TPA: hypothetical protein VF170_19400 [Planctomycetaceae bacterium]